MPTSPAPAPTAAQRFSPDTIPQSASQEGPVLLAMKPADASRASLSVARWLAAREERELHVVTVLQRHEALALPIGSDPLSDDYFEAERRDFANVLRRRLDDSALAGDPPRLDVLEGPIAQAIVALSRSRGARVIVIGTGGHATIGRHIFGERALQILSVADRPVLIVPSDTVAGPVPVAVVAVDFSPSSARAARAVFPMLAEQSHLHLVHVRTASSLKTEMLGWPDDAYEARCADLFRHFVRQLPALPGVTVETACVSGDAADSLVRYATTAQAGLIACGRLGHSLIERLFVRSVSAALVRRAPCPVLVIPEQPGDAAR